MECLTRNASLIAATDIPYYIIWCTKYVSIKPNALLFKNEYNVSNTFSQHNSLTTVQFTVLDR